MVDNFARALNLKVDTQPFYAVWLPASALLAGKPASLGTLQPL